MTNQCPQCGDGPAVMSPSVAERRHQQFHVSWEYGVAIPPGVSVPDNSVLTVPANGAKVDVELAYKMAGVSQMALGKEAPSFAHA